MTIPAELGPGLPGWAVVGPARRAHIERVARLAHQWGSLMGVPRAELDRWLNAAWLHDALRDADEAVLTEWADAAGSIALLHGPAAAGRAKALGETDRGVLDAVRYHSVGLAEWEMVGQVLYCADFLEPGRTVAAERRAELAARFPADPAAVMREVTRWRLGSVIESGWTIPEPTYRLWNQLVAAASPA